MQAARSQTLIVQLPESQYEGHIMLRYAVIFLVVALIAAFFGFAGVTSVAVDAAKILFFVFLVLFAVSLILGRRTPSGDVI
jgi:uncharacterized membrane protein YtjA (UPF0391 family)